MSLCFITHAGRQTQIGRADSIHFLDDIISLNSWNLI